MPGNNLPGALALETTTAPAMPGPEGGGTAEQAELSETEERERDAALMLPAPIVTAVIEACRHSILQREVLTEAVVVPLLAYFFKNK